jgi:DNA-binding NtrC family response regulator
MRKILLVIEDYHERTYLQTMLKKIGWDVIGLSTELGLSEQILTFRPDAIFASQSIRRIQGIELLKNIKKRDGYPKLLLIGTNPPTKADLDAHHVDVFLSSPVNNRLLFEFLEKAGGFSAKASLQKIRNMRYPLEKMTDDSKRLPKSHSEEPESLAPTIEKVVFDDTADRKRRYDEFLLKNPVQAKQTHFKASDIQDFTGKIAAEGYTEEGKKLDENKKDFVKALFGASKKKS